MFSLLNNNLKGFKFESFFIRMPSQKLEIFVRGTKFHSPGFHSAETSKNVANLFYFRSNLEEVFYVVCFIV